MTKLLGFCSEKQIHKSSYLSFSKSDLLKVSFFKVSKELKSLSFRERW